VVFLGLLMRFLLEVWAYEDWMGILFDDVDLEVLVALPEGDLLSEFAAKP
jgi:hypothetical protein